MGKGSLPEPVENEATPGGLLSSRVTPPARSLAVPLCKQLHCLSSTKASPSLSPWCCVVVSTAALIEEQPETEEVSTALPSYGLSSVL